MLPKNRRNVFSHKNTYITQVMQAVIFNFMIFLTAVYSICCCYNKIAMVKMCKKLKMERILENLFFLLFDTKINSYIDIKNPLLIYFMNKELSAERSI